MNDSPRETVLVTGASSGIGLELARLFAADGSDLVLVARSVEKLKALAEELSGRHGVRVEVLAADLADPEAPAEVQCRVADAGLTVDVLVNNAGFGARGSVAELGPERQVALVQVNVTALTHLTALFVPGMIERGQGGVLNVASTAGFQPGPHMSAYYAAKAYVLAFTEGLAVELKGTGVTASCLAPGATHTGFAEEAGTEDTLLFKLGAMDAVPVARIGYRGFRRGKVIVIPGLKNKVGAVGVRFLPRAWTRRITARLQG